MTRAGDHRSLAAAAERARELGGHTISTTMHAAGYARSAASAEAAIGARSAQPRPPRRW